MAGMQGFEPQSLGPKPSILPLNYIPIVSYKTAIFYNKPLKIRSNTAYLKPPKYYCKYDGWKTFNNPYFKNKGQCVSYTNHL